jgi:rubrerythrin
MIETGSIDELFDQAIAVEQAAQHIYEQFARLFAPHSAVAAFWTQYAAEEAQHARWLDRLRESLTPDQRAALADPQMLASARALVQSAESQPLNRIFDLNDAFQLAHYLESSEVNTIFEFLIKTFDTDPEIEEYVHAQIKGHVERLIVEFPRDFGGMNSRLSVPADHTQLS